MSDVPQEVFELTSEIRSGLEVLAEIGRFIKNYDKEKISHGICELEQALVISQALTNYYTCLETQFLRISQYFENSLEKEQWHKRLLEKMVLDIDGIRPPVISKNLLLSLMELLKYRHFSRYYFQLNYDWDKIQFVLKKFYEVDNVIYDEINLFLNRLKNKE